MAITRTPTSHWAADLTPGEHSSSLHYRLRDTFAGDPILSMYVPAIATGLTNALIDAFCVPESDTELVVEADMTRDKARTTIANVIGASVLSILSPEALSYLRDAITNGLYPHAAAQDTANAEAATEAAEASTGVEKNWRHR